MQMKKPQKLTPSQVQGAEQWLPTFPSKRCCKRTSQTRKLRAGVSRQRGAQKDSDPQPPPRGPGSLPRAPSRNVPKGYSRPQSRRERSEPGRCAATGWGGPAPGSSCDRSACIRETCRDPLEAAQEGNRAGAGGGERLNVRIRFNQCPPARRSSDPQHPNSRRAGGGGQSGLRPRSPRGRMERTARMARMARRRRYL